MSAEREEKSMNNNEIDVIGFYSEEDIRSRLGISTFAFHGIRPLNQAALNDICANGISIIEIFPEEAQFSFEHPDSMRHIRSECEAIGLSVASFHCPRIKYEAEDEDERHAEVERSKRMIDTLIWFGGKVWVIHADITSDQMIVPDKLSFFLTVVLSNLMSSKRDPLYKIIP